MKMTRRLFMALLAAVGCAPGVEPPRSPFIPSNVLAVEVGEFVFSGAQGAF